MGMYLRWDGNMDGGSSVLVDDVWLVGWEWRMSLTRTGGIPSFHLSAYLLIRDSYCFRFQDAFMYGVRHLVSGSADLFG